MKDYQQENKKSSFLVKAGLIVVFLIAAILLAAFAYQQAQKFFVSYDVTNLPGLAIASSQTPVLDEQGTPIPATPVPATGPDGPTPQPWDGASRINVLVMGLDYGDWASADREGPPRTDTMILFTIDPLTKTAGWIHIPRDLWVNIPGFEYGRINTAYMLGEAYQVPGGGPALASQTIEQLLGVPINYYAQVDFYAFEKFIDRIDGVLIDVPYEMKIDPIGKYNTIILQPGEQRLYGPEALAYARARYTDGGDFDRSQRQMQVIMAIRKRVLKPSFFPVMLSRAPDLYNELASGIHTNMTFDEAIKFAWLAREIPEENIRKGAIAPPDMVLFATSPDGAQQILKPIPDRIRQLRDEIFASDIAYNPSTASTDLAGMMKEEAPRIQVLNGTGTEGLASKTQEYLLSQGATNVTVGNAGELLASSKIIDYSGQPYTRRYLVDLMGIPDNNIYYENNPASDVDIVIMLGQDWASNNPMP
jgi:polyisoprenyl-teichoic acid--peptidoglycan teichoic acid transferase